MLIFFFFYYYHLDQSRWQNNGRTHAAGVIELHCEIWKRSSIFETERSFFFSFLFLVRVLF